MHINSISLSALELPISVRLMHRLRCSRIFSTLLSLRCVLSPTTVSGADSLWPACPCTNQHPLDRHPNVLLQQTTVRNSRFLHYQIAYSRKSCFSVCSTLAVARSCVFSRAQPASRHGACGLRLLPWVLEMQPAPTMRRPVFLTSTLANR